MTDQQPDKLPQPDTARTGGADVVEARHRLAREEIAQIEIGHTDVGPAMRRVVVALFLVVVLVPGVIEMVGFAVARSRGEADRRTPHAFAIFERVPEAALRGYSEGASEADRPDAGPLRRAWDGMFRANALALREINDYEDELSEQSRLGEAIRPPTQAFLTGELGAGNEQVYVGRDGWLFYRPGFDYVTGPPFLSGKQLAKRARTGSEYVAPPQPDPRKAVLQFRDQLRERGIELILLPTPVKPVVHPEMYDAAAASATAPVRNVSFDAFVQEMRDAGVLMLDPAPMLFEAGRKAPQYLPGDTHWRPEGMERTAAAIREFIESHDLLLAAAPAGYTRREEHVSEFGDLVELLDIPADYGVFSPTDATIHPVSARGDSRWQPDPVADVLLMGDSFSNIFSLGAMGWGESAGLAEQISFELQRPVDRIVRNSDGAKATRAILSNELAAGRDRLAGKKVVIWEFASRELSVGDWQLLPMALGEPPTQEFVVPEAGQVMEVSGTVAAVSSVPRPGSVPYSDHVFTVHLVGLEGAGVDGGQSVVYLKSMTANELTPAARLAPGDRVKMRLRPWFEVEDKLGGLNRSDLDDIDLQLQEHAYGELAADTEGGEARPAAGAVWPVWTLLGLLGLCVCTRLFDMAKRVERNEEGDADDSETT